jgi:acyl dehydratase
MTVRVFGSPGELLHAVGAEIGPGDPHPVTQETINLFADATGDHQWIHIDAERAAAGPFGRTVAHGFLTLSLIPVLVRGLYRVDGARMAVNYGLNRVRFPAPVRSGDSVRAVAAILAAEETGGSVQLTVRVTIAVEAAEKPACVAEVVTRFYP